MSLKGVGPWVDPSLEMQKPPKPQDEERRLRALHSLHILDTPAEERFDRVTRIARRLFKVPIALVSLLDTDRQWFKSRQGLGVSETSRDVSFCGHTILSSKTMVVEDALADARFTDNPLVVGDPSIRFYAGCPLHSPDGHRLGTLCLIDRVPRELSEPDAHALRDLSDMVEAEIASIVMATTDVLTGISNRRGFEMLAEQTLHMAVRNSLPIAMIHLDLDHFKQINDTLGHDAGDQALIEISDLLLGAFRTSDVVARLGGDEFGVLMSAIEESEVKGPLERLARRIAERNADPSARFAIHYSAGIVTDPMTKPRSVSDLLAEADQRMYERKAERRAKA